VAVVAPASWTFGASRQVLPDIERLNPSGYVWGATVTPAAQANVDFLTALVPVAESSWSKRPAVAPLDPSARDAGLTVTDGARVTAVLFGRLPTDLTRAGGYTLAGLSGVAESASGKPVRALLVRGTRLEDATRPLLRHDGAAIMLEADGLDGEQVALSGDALQQAILYAPRAKQVTWNQAVVPFTRDGDFVTVSVSGSNASGGGGGSGSGPSVPQTPSHASGCASGLDAGGLALAGLAVAWWLRRRRP
jgi:MYXO-CTERM domain-containing protein